MHISREIRKKIHYIIPAVVFTIASIVIFGYYKDIKPLETVTPNGVHMRVSTALMFILASIMMSSFSYFKKMFSKSLCLFASILILLVDYTLVFVRFPDIAYAIEKNLGYSYFVKTVLDPANSPSVATMINFPIIAMCGLFSVINSKLKAIRIASLYILSSGSVGLLGHILNMPRLYSYSHISPGMSLHTCLLYILTGFNIWLLHKTYSQSEI